jgi:hypothetical protein
MRVLLDSRWQVEHLLNKVRRSLCGNGRLHATGHRIAVHTMRDIRIMG